jgi:hypothetical protein
VISLFVGHVTPGHETDPPRQCAQQCTQLYTYQYPTGLSVICTVQLNRYHIQWSSETLHLCTEYECLFYSRGNQCPLQDQCQVRKHSICLQKIGLYCAILTLWGLNKTVQGKFTMCRYAYCMENTVCFCKNIMTLDSFFFLLLCKVFATPHKPFCGF